MFIYYFFILLFKFVISGRDVTMHKCFKYLFDQKELNMRQWRWIEFLEDYDYELLLHTGKPNVVANALSRKMVHVAHMMINELKLIERFRDIKL